MYNYTAMPDEQAGLGPAGIENPEEEVVPVQSEPTLEQAPAMPESEPVKEQSGKYEKLLQVVANTNPVAAVNDTEAKNDLSEIQALEGATAKVDQLVKLAQAKGLPHAVRVAEQMKDYYTLDVFHDSLADAFYDTLVQQGVITKE